MAKRHNIDAVHRHTSKQLTHLEKAIRRLYRKAATNAASVGAHYFNRYRSEWNAKLKQLKDGDITTTEWIQWATDTVFYGEDFARVSDELIALLSNTDADALALINHIRTDVFVHAHNYTAYMIERTFYDTAFTLVDAHTLGVLQSTAHPLPCAHAEQEEVHAMDAATHPQRSDSGHHAGRVHRQDGQAPRKRREHEQERIGSHGPHRLHVRREHRQTASV